MNFVTTLWQDRNVCIINNNVIMAALCNRAGRYIFARLLSSSYGRTM